MKAVICLNFPYCDQYDWFNGMTRVYNGVMPGLGDALIGRIIDKPWIAEITGVHPVYKLSRSFVPSKRDYSEASSSGKRGVKLWFTVESGKYYEIKARISRKRWRRYFVTVTDSGDVVEVDKEDVMAWAKNR